MSAIEKYLNLMSAIRDRLDLINQQRSALTSSSKHFLIAETAAFHGRKVVEAIAFSCLTTIEHGIKEIPKDAKGQWNAEKIFRRISKMGYGPLPSPSQIRDATEEEFRTEGAKVVIEGIADRRLKYDELIEIYQNLHIWLHEVNPYVHDSHNNFFDKHAARLWLDLQRIEAFIVEHFISIKGEGFFCVLRDKQDGKTKVLPLSKIQA